MASFAEMGLLNVLLGYRLIVMVGRWLSGLLLSGVGYLVCFVDRVYVWVGKRL